jgi:uncharacterized protein YijF (DUF1287 family)
MKIYLQFIWLVLLALFFASCEKKSEIISTNPIAQIAIRFADSVNWPYNADYQLIPYPNGDVRGGGVCTDVVIRVLREVGIDLQKEVHEDMRLHFSEYPKLWGLIAPDKNIDHRRVPNLMTWFSRKGYDVGVSDRLTDYQPGDIICWRLSGGLTHTGIHVGDGAVFHNIGPRAKLERDFLFDYTIIGHYRIKNS